MGNEFRDQSPEKCDDGQARRDLAHSCVADDGTAAAQFLRRLTVCQEMAVAFGRGCGFASGRPLGATGPRMESYNWKAKPISPCLGAHEAHPALNRLMMQTESLSDSEERGFLTVRKQYLRPLRPTRRFAPRAGNSCQLFNIFIGHRQFDCLPPPCHLGPGFARASG
jgi:hypothetical protein